MNIAEQQSVIGDGMALSPSNDSGSRILMIDDDIKLCRLIRDYLQPMGYQVSFTHSGNEGLEMASRGNYTAIILDLMLPGLDGLELLRRLRAQSNVPVLMLTGRGEESDRIVGLEMGADDYLPKTFSTRELLARLRAVIRRSLVAANEQNQRTTITVGTLTIDEASRTVTLDSAPVILTAVEFDILKSLAASAGRVKTREQLLLEVADRNFDVFDRSIDVHVSSLRKKLGDDPKTPRFIVTIRSVGYMMRKPGSDAIS
jgi:DNA-binding response OmpR family regulator